ncbi:phasin family protein [Rhodoplanes sp. Z2-YC6860]|uniref:phasin family protein n=1 Tax=Rhodoplanes sp. Z2-YC6860 TaxID=674703 RepID=UPI00078D02BD|nr:phasin family protein [Rhodoplanes sp. Z2-YC6860]AMN44557.1 phasin 2 [Rhodoplanes sp. Z2-YC6860]
MTDNPFNTMFPPEMRAFAEQSVAQARKAFDELMAATQRTISTFEGQTGTAPWGFRGLQQKVVTFSERNIAASFDFAQRLLHAKDGEEVMRLHADFVKAQIQALTEQARELAQSAGAAAAPPAGNGKGTG